MAVLEGHTSGVNTAAFNQDGSRIVTASDDGTARVWVGIMIEADATLVEAMKHAKDKKVQLVLCAMHEKVHAIFEIARLHSYFRIETSLDEALV